MTKRILVATLGFDTIDLKPDQVFSHHEVTLFKDGVAGEPVQLQEGTVTFTDMEPGTYYASSQSMSTTGKSLAPPVISETVTIDAPPATKAHVVNSISLVLEPLDESEKTEPETPAPPSTDPAEGTTVTDPTKTTADGTPTGQQTADNQPATVVDPLSKGLLVNPVTVDSVDEDGTKHMSDGSVDVTDKRIAEGGVLQRKEDDGGAPTATSGTDDVLNSKTDTGGAELI